MEILRHRTDFYDQINEKVSLEFRGHSYMAWSKWMKLPSD